jgi:hypothetical protein
MITNRLLVGATGMPAQASIQQAPLHLPPLWIPAFAGMTTRFVFIGVYQWFRILCFRASSSAWRYDVTRYGRNRARMRLLSLYSGFRCSAHSMSPMLPTWARSLRIRVDVDQSILQDGHV